MLFGNEVTSIELSQKLLDYSQSLYPKSEFPKLDLKHGNALDLSETNDEAFDVVYFPQNGIDLVESNENRIKVMKEMFSKLKPGGLLVFGSHNIQAYALSYKLPKRDRTFDWISKDHVFRQGKTTGEGNLFLGRPDYVVNQVTQNIDVKFLGYTADHRNRMERKLSKNMRFAKYLFPYFIYVFQK